MFDGVKEKLTLKLKRTRAFGNGNVLLCYEPAAVKEEHNSQVIEADPMVNRKIAGLPWGYAPSLSSP